MQRFTSERPRRRVMDSIATPDVSGSFDPVTGLATREMFRRRAEAEWQRRTKEQGPMSLLRIDLDNAESNVARLREVAEVVARHCRRRGDFAGRIGAHDIVVLLSETAPKGAEKIARQIVEDVNSIAVEGDVSGSRITVSIGVASIIPRSSRFLDSLLRLAEEGVEQASKNGGNQIISMREGGS